MKARDARSVPEFVICGKVQKHEVLLGELSPGQILRLDLRLRFQIMEY